MVRVCVFVFAKTKATGKRTLKVDFTFINRQTSKVRRWVRSSRPWQRPHVPTPLCLAQTRHVRKTCSNRYFFTANYVITDVLYKALGHER